MEYLVREAYHHGESELHDGAACCGADDEQPNKDEAAQHFDEFPPTMERGEKVREGERRWETEEQRG